MQLVGDAGLERVDAELGRQRRRQVGHQFLRFDLKDLQDEELRQAAVEALDAAHLQTGAGDVGHRAVGRR